MGLDALLVRLKGRAVTPATLDDVTPEPAPVQACTPVTAVTSQIINDVVNVGAGDTATASRCWLIHYPERDPVELTCCPEATHADILAWHPDAVAAEPFEPIRRQPTDAMTADEDQAIRAWLAHIGEADQEIIDDVLGQCQQDADARDYFTGRAAAELPGA